jgi:hypothetical protein
MCKKTFFVIPVCVTLFLYQLQSVFAQTDTQKYEVGIVYTAIRQNDDFFQLIEGFEPRIRHNYGYGGRFTFNATDHLAIECEITFHPKDRFVLFGGLFPPTTEGSVIGGKRTQGLFGVKAGKRFEKIGLFGKVRPGFMRLSNIPDCPNGALSRCTTGGKTGFALDVGGVFEYYPTRRLVVRFDIGDTIIKYGKLNRAEFPDTPPEFQLPLKIGGGTTHNAQYSIGLGFRF